MPSVDDISYTKFSPTRLATCGRIQYTAEPKSQEVVFDGRQKVESASQKFDRLHTKWHTDTAHLSSVRDKIIHPAYQSIIGMGETALPFILRELKKKPGHWFWALSRITELDLVPQGTDLREAVKIWMDWWEKNRPDAKLPSPRSRTTLPRLKAHAV